MRDAQPRTVYLKDYKPPVFLIDKTELTFELGEDVTKVSSKLSLRRNPESQDKNGPLILDGGAGLDLQYLALDQQQLKDDQYARAAETLIISAVPDSFVLETQVLIKPQENTTLEGLYKSRAMFCTQCEAEGFRHITFYLDRPDVMSEFVTRVIADKKTYPVLLSNGNPVGYGELDDGRHFVTWHDPFRKPAYLFALVAGTLSCVDDSFTTCSGREVALKIYVEEKDLDKCDHAMRSLKKAMRWDEEKYGREYDLDIFMIVAVDDFNMGAMENKGLNIFNTSAVLCNPKTSTDAAFQRIESVVAHEYFHNWSGNRVTCRDWFQLSLKEGFTVFRDSQFSADMNSATVKRIEEISMLRTFQFAEDGGPMSHPVQPDSYMEINNFYTMTVYEKGAEVVRMIQTLLGPEAFRNGCDLYFERHDGQAVTIEDFVRAMQEASGRDLTQFRRWYKQSGTPRLKVSQNYDSKARSLTLAIEQSCPPTPGQDSKQPYLIPLRMGLVGKSGDLALDDRGRTQQVFEITESTQTLRFENIPEAPVPSLLRGFSAPVKLDYPYTPAELARLMAEDSDGFNRWDASQKLGLIVLKSLVDDVIAGHRLSLSADLTEACRSLLSNPELDPAMVALMLLLPGELLLHEESDVIHPQAIHKARLFARKELAMALADELEAVYRRLQSSEPYAPDAEQIGRRSLKNAALQYLSLVPGAGVEISWKQYESADNMTDQLAALTALVNCPDPKDYDRLALDLFQQQWRAEALVMNLWFQTQALSIHPGCLARVKELMQHPDFSMTNPNKVRSLIGAFCNSNLVNFHHPDGQGYLFLQEQVLALNSINPQIASRLVTPLTRWKKFAEPHSHLMYESLQAIAREPALARDIYEVASKSL